MNKTPQTLFRSRWIRSLAWTSSLLLCACASPPSPTVGRGADSVGTEKPPAARSVSGGTSTAEALVLFSRGISHEAHDDVPTAVSNYLTAVKLDPSNESLVMLASHRLIERDHQEEALALLDAFLAEVPDSATVTFWTGMVHLGQMENATALELFRRAVQLDPTLEAAYVQGAGLLHREGNSEQAIALLESGIPHMQDLRRLGELRVALLLQKANESLDPTQAAEFRERALQGLLTIAEQNPALPDARLQAATLLARAEKIVPMLEQYRHLDHLEPDSVAHRHALLLHLIRALGNNAELASAKLTAYLHEYPDDGFVHYLSAQLLELKRETALAIDEYEKAAALLPGEQSPRWKHAVLLAGSGSPDAAMAVLQAALHQNPGHVELRLLQATLLIERQRFPEAVAAFEEIQERVSQGESLRNAAGFHLNYAIALQAVGQGANAAEHLSLAMGGGEDVLNQFWARTMRAAHSASPDKHLENERIRALQNTLEQLAKRMPDSPLVSRRLGAHHLANRNFSEAARVFALAEKQALQADKPGELLDADFFYQFGAAEDQAGNPDAAERLLKKCITLNPKHANAHNHLAYMWAEKGVKLEEAMEYVGRALELEPMNGAFLDTRGWVHYRMGNHDEAYRDLLAAAEQIDDDPIVAEHLGDVLMKLDRVQEAAAYYRIALEMDGVEDTVRSKLEAAEKALEL